MKDKINLEITNTNNRILSNKTKLELANMEFKKNQLIYFNKLKQHKRMINDKNKLEEQKISSEYLLDSENFVIKEIDNNNDFIRNNKYGKIRNGNNLWIDFGDNIISKPFSGIKSIDNIVHKAEFNIKLKWQTKGNNTFSTGPIVWDNRNNITYNINNIKDGIKIGIKNIPNKNDFLNANIKKNNKSSIFIMNEKHHKFWFSWKDFNLEFWGSPLKEIKHTHKDFNRFTEYYNDTDNIISILINNKISSTYQIYKWDTSLKKVNVTTNTYKLVLKPKEHFAISYDGRIELNIQINNVQYPPNKEHISKWYEVDIPKNHYFSFNTHKDLGYKFEINFSENIYNSNIFLNDYDELYRKHLLELENIKKESIISKKDFDESKQLLEQLNTEIKVLNEKKTILKLHDRVTKEYDYINNKIKLLTEETNIERAEDTINYLKTSHIIFNEVYNEYIPDHFDKSDVLIKDQEEINQYRFEIQEMYYKSEDMMSDVRNISQDVKQSLFSNWKKIVDDDFEIILNNNNLITLECQEVNNLKNKIYTEVEWRDNIANTFKYYKK